jgi:hypothetical protein
MQAVAAAAGLLLLQQAKSCCLPVVAFNAAATVSPS